MALPLPRKSTLVVWAQLEPLANSDPQSNCCKPGIATGCRQHWSTKHLDHCSCHLLRSYYDGVRLNNQRGVFWREIPEWLCRWDDPDDCNNVYWRGKPPVSMAATYTDTRPQIVPLALRGLMTCLVALSFTVGPFTVALIVNSTGTLTTRWAYRAVFCSQYGFAAVVAAFIGWMPESPWFLISRRNDEAKALRSLQRLGYSSSSGEDVKRLANIKLTLEHARKETVGVTYLECFRKSNLRRTIISVAPLCIQMFTGIVFAASYSTYYAQLAGYSTAMSFKLQIVQQVLSMFGNVISWYLIDKTGRRPLTVYGTVGLTVVLWIMGGLAVGGSVGELKATVAMILIYCWLYNVTIGATAFTVLTEVSTSRLRAKTIGIGLAAQGCLNIFWSFTLPYLFNPDKANLGGKLGFIFGGLCFPCIAFLWWYHPETKGRSYEELDEMFMKKIPARKFRTYVTDTQSKSEEVQRRASAI